MSEIGILHEQYLKTPEIYRLALQLIRDIGDQVPLQPADDMALHTLVDLYGISLRPITDFPNLEQYLTGVFLLRDYLRVGLLNTDILGLEKHYQNCFEECKPLKTGDYDELSQEMKKYLCLPYDSVYQVSRIAVIINFAFQRYLSNYGINIEKYPQLTYFGNIPDFFNVSCFSEELPVQVLIHRGVQNPRAIRDLKGESDSDLSDLEPADRIPAYELQNEVLKIADKLKYGWSMVDKQRLISKWTDEMGFPVEMDVRGYARLPLNSHFVDIAREKYRIFLESLIRIPVDGLPDIEIDDYRSKRNFNLGGDYYLPEYRILESIFLELFDPNFKIATQLNWKNLPLDMDADILEWMIKCVEDPTILEMNEINPTQISSLTGILSDIPFKDIEEEVNSGSSDPLLVSCTATISKCDGNYSLYVHPVIWKRIKEYLGSDLVL